MTVAPRAQFGQGLADEAVNADPLETDGVDHPGRRLDDAGRRMALPLGEEQALDGDGSEGRQVNQVGVLDTVPEAAARGDERVLQREGADSDREIQIYSHAISFPGSTGPAMQERTWWSRPCSSLMGTTQL